MYIEKSRYRSSVRVRIVQKVLVSGVWKKQLVAHVGSAAHPLDIEVLLIQAKQTLADLRLGDQLALGLTKEPATSHLQRVGEHWQLAEAALGNLYDRLHIETTQKLPFLRAMVIARIVFPASKLRTASFLSECLAVPCGTDKLYRAMDSLAIGQDAVLKQVRLFTARTYPAALGYVLYDVTTLYFEAEVDDEDSEYTDANHTTTVVPGLRKKGYSKDHRGDLPQVVLGLAVNGLGMPLSYQLHSGDTYEGHTLLNGIDATLDVLSETDLTVVADAGMLSDKNLGALEERGLHYIVGARLRSLGKADQAKILKLDFSQQKQPQNQPPKLYQLEIGGRRLVVSYSEKRATRAKSLRDKSIARLERLIAKGTAVRKHSYLDFTVKDAPKLKQAAIDATAQWDGIKGYFTNRSKQEMSASEVISHYTSLFRVEQSFRMYKSDVAVRPAFHYKPERIQAHVVICMIALTIMRILEQEVKPLGLTIPQALQEICSAKAAVISLNGQEFVVPPAYTNLQTKILKATG
jgi:transposase